MANLVQTNGWSVLTDGAVLAFYAARYNNNSGTILASETYNWAYDQGERIWYVNGTIQNFRVSFSYNNAIDWTGYYEGGIGGQNVNFGLRWENVVTDDLTHHYYFHVARGGDGFGNQTTVSLYIDGKFVSSKQILYTPGIQVWLNRPMGVGSNHSGYGTRQTIETRDGNRYISYGEYLDPDFALSLIGQLWFGYGFATPELGLDNLWRNGYVDLGPNGTNGAVTEILPQFYNDFGYAGAGFTSRTGLGSIVQLQATDIRIRQASSAIVARTTLTARGKNFSDYLAKLQVNSTVTAAVGYRKTIDSNMSSASQLTANNIRLKDTSANLDSKFTIYADLRRAGNNVQAESNFTLTCSAQISAQAQIQLDVQAVQQTIARRNALAASDLTVSTQIEARGGAKRLLAANLSAFNSVNVTANYDATFSAFLVARTTLTANVADYQLRTQATLTARGNYTTLASASLTSQATQTTLGNYNTNGSADLQAFATQLTLAQTRAKTTDLLKVTSESRRLKVHRETRVLEVVSETRHLNVLNT